MRMREILEYVAETPFNTNPNFLKSMIQEYAADAANPLSAYTVDVNIADSVDLLGKKASDLQEGVYIVDGKFYGTLHYVTNYTGFSGLPEEQEGHYVVYHVAYEGADTIKVNGVTLDSDGIMVQRIKKLNQKPYATVEIIDGGDSFTEKLDLSGLKYE